MKPTQFIKDHGLEKAREVVEGAPEGATQYELTVDGDFYFKYESFDWFCFAGGELIRTYMDDYETSHLIDLRILKRLVESVDLVKEHYTLERAIKYANSPYTAPEVKERLAQAIKDYESIYGEGNE